MSDLELYADLSTRTLVTSDGSTLTPPALVLGDQCICSLTIMDRLDGVNLTEIDLNVRTLHASIGSVLEPPDAGTFSLQLAGNTSPAFSLATTAAQMLAALQAIDEGTLSYDLREVSAPAPRLLAFAFREHGDHTTFRCGRYSRPGVLRPHRWRPRRGRCG